MSNLRKEFTKIKQERDQYINEAAYKWLEKNVILINERIDRKTVKKLTDSILKFDEKFGPFKSKIPTIAKQLDIAENNLELVVTGKVNDKRASDMLKQLSYLYRVYSEFFNIDLPILLNTNIFASAKANPDVRLDSIQPVEGTKYSPMIIRDSFKHALSPSKEEQKLAKKIYSPKNIPTVNSLEIANELLALSFNELQKLTEIEKMPMVATDEVTSESKQINENILLEVNVQKLRALNNSIERLENLFNPFQDRMPNLNKVLDDLKLKLSDVQANLGAGAIDKIKSFFGGGVEKNILATYEIFRNFKQVAQEVSRLLNKAPQDKPINQLLTDPNNGQLATNAVNLIKQSVKPGIFGKSVIDPNTFADEISNLNLNQIKSLSNGINLPDAQEVQPELDKPEVVGQNNANVPDTQAANVSIATPNEPQTQTAVNPEPQAPDNTNQQAPQQPETTTSPSANLTPDEVVNTILQKKKISSTIQRDLKSAVDYLNKNGFKVTQ